MDGLISRRGAAMQRRDFLVRAGAILSTGVASTHSGIGASVGAALAAGQEDRGQVSLEKKLADFADSIRYGDLPAAIAVCEESGKNGRDLIEAIVVGYEASARINDAISFMERGFHPLCAASYGIPLIAGKVWGLSKDSVANAIGLSAARGYTSF